MRRIWIPSIALLVIALAGCSPGNKVVGKWTTRPSDQSASDSSPLASAAASFMSADLDVRKDGTYTLKLLGTSVEGKWEFSQDTLTLNLDSVTGIGMVTLGVKDKAWKGTLEGDKLQFATRDAPVSASVVFRRIQED